MSEITRGKLVRDMVTLRKDVRTKILQIIHLEKFGESLLTEVKVPEFIWREKPDLAELLELYRDLTEALLHMS